MNELKTLLESELLSDDVKKELAEAVEQYRTQLVEETKKGLEVEFAKKLTREKKSIAEKVMEHVSEIVAEEIKELKEDLAHYKDLEVTYAKKLEEFKTSYAEKLEEGFKELVESHVKEEIEELRDDLIEAKKHNFGKKLFEAFAAEFEEFGIGDDVKELRAKLEESAKAIEESQATINEMKREKVIGELLSNLSGSKKEVMKTILEGVETDKLSERYEETIKSVLSDEDGKGQEEEKKVVLESKDTGSKISEHDRIRALIGGKK